MGEDFEMTLNCGKAKILLDFLEMLGSNNIANVIGCEPEDKEADDIANLVMEITSKIRDEPVGFLVEQGRYIGLEGQTDA